jgi:hypothetical protein
MVQMESFSMLLTKHVLSGERNKKHETKTRITALIFTLALALCIISTQANTSFNGELSAKTEAQTIGGEVALFVGGFSWAWRLAHSTLAASACTTGAWYSLIELNGYQ